MSEFADIFLGVRMVNESHPFAICPVKKFERVLSPKERVKLFMVLEWPKQLEPYPRRLPELTSSR